MNDVEENMFVECIVGGLGGNYLSVQERCMIL